jgi:hypothetical protein
LGNAREEFSLSFSYKVCLSQNSFLILASGVTATTIGKFLKSYRNESNAPRFCVAESKQPLHSESYIPNSTALSCWEYSVNRAINIVSLLLLTFEMVQLQAAQLDLSHAVIVTRDGELPAAEKIAAQVLVEEMAKRTGLTLQVSTQWPGNTSAIIALSVVKNPPAWKEKIPADAVDGKSFSVAEGFSIHVVPPSGANDPAVVYVTGADARGLLFGVGKLLTNLEWSQGRIRVDTNFNIELSPNVPLRGHQLGYRARANSWDAWTPAQFDQYIRELVICGANAIENIPFEDTATSPHMPVSREVMNAEMSRICARYDVQYWVWVPVEFSLPDASREEEYLKTQAAFYNSCERLDAVFVPGGDPGHNEASNLMPFMKRMGALLLEHHPNARVWISLQGFTPKSIEDFFSYVNEHNPDWLGGVVMGPSSPPLELTRKRLPERYGQRWYPDITHIVRCQYPVPWLDPAWGLTIGREPVNPRPTDYTAIYRDGYRYTNGFLTYSDGIHDDFNKTLWSQLGWNPDRSPRDIAIEYARFFFRPDLATSAADAIFALETNLRGSLADNSSVDGTLLMWQKLEAAMKSSKTDWRFDLHLMRAYYDAYTRQRLLYETDLEEQALTAFEQSATIGVKPALDQAREILERASTCHVNQSWLDKLYAFADSLFERIGYQTLMEKHKASGSERGVVMEFVNYPLNNRWWLEDQFALIEQTNDPAQQSEKIKNLINWDHPAPDSFHEIIGHVAFSPSIPKLLNGGDAMRHYQDMPMPTQRWMGEKRRGLRQSWHNYLNAPNGMVYSGLDPKARYTVKLFAQQTSPLEIDGVRAKQIRTGETYDEVTEQEFEVSPDSLQDGKIELTWEQLDETHLNWRNRHYVCELWVIKQP